MTIQEGFRTARLSLPWIALSVVLAASGRTALADPIPYPNVGTVPPVVALTATSTGTIEGYYISANASDTDEIAMLDVTSGIESSFGFNNQSTSPGNSIDFGSVNSGDEIVFILKDITSGDFYTNDPSELEDNDNGYNHAYITPYTSTDVSSGPAGVPLGTYVGFEDLYIPGADEDYNDDTFVFTDLTSTSPTPEPGSLILLGTGVFAASGLLRRRLAVR